MEQTCVQCLVCVCCPVRQRSIYVCVSWQSEGRCSTMNNNCSLPSQSLTTEWITHGGAEQPQNPNVTPTIHFPNLHIHRLMHLWRCRYPVNRFQSRDGNKLQTQISERIMNPWHKESLLWFVAELLIGQNAQCNMVHLNSSLIKSLPESRLDFSWTYINFFIRNLHVLASIPKT